MLHSPTAAGQRDDADLVQTTARQIVDELGLKLTHTIPMDWILPGIPPTGKRVEVPLVAIVRVRDGKLAHEHIYWDQASVLVQIGSLDPAKLPVVGVESAKEVLIPLYQQTN